MKKIQMVVMLCVLFFAQEGFSEIDSFDCDKKIRNSSNPNLECSLKFYLNDKERDELKNTNSNVINDCSCTVRINTPKSVLIESLTKDIVNIPPLKINCDLSFKDNIKKQCDFSISPEFHFKGDKVNDVKLNVSKIDGIGFLGTALRNYLNNDPQIKEDIKKAVNAAIHDLFSR